MRGLIFFLENRFQIFTIRIPLAMLRAKAQKPPTIIPRVCRLRKASTVIVAPTQSPRKIVAAFIRPLLATLKSLDVSAPISLMRLPNISIPTSGTAVGTKIATMVVTAMGKIIFTARIFLIFSLSG